MIFVFFVCRRLHPIALNQSLHKLDAAARDWWQSQAGPVQATKVSKQQLRKMFGDLEDPSDDSADDVAEVPAPKRQKVVHLAKLILQRSHLSCHCFVWCRSDQALGPKGLHPSVQIE